MIGHMLRNKISVNDITMRVPLYHERVPVVVLWSEKAACTTVVKWYLSQVGILLRALNYHNWIHNFENEVFKTSDGYLEKCADAMNRGQPVIKFVRNPYTRLYSGYLETCRRRVLTDNEHWSTQTRKAVLTDLVGEDTELEYAYSFNQFVDWLDHKKGRGLDPHLSIQYQAYEEKLDIDLIKLEGSNAVFQDVEGRYGLKNTKGRPVIYKSGHHHKKQQRSIREQQLSLSLIHI